MQIIKKSLIIIICFFIVSCQKEDIENINKSLKEKRKPKIGLALSYAGIGDLSFNDMQYNGVIRALQLYDLEFSYTVPREDTEKGVHDAIKKLADENCDLVFSGGFLALEPIKKIAPKYKNTHFVILDEVSNKYDNVSYATYAQHEGSFVVGALAAMMSKSEKIGFIGGVDMKIIKAFLQGYKEGVSYIDKNKKVVVVYCSLYPDFSGYSSPNKGYEVANKLFKQNIDVLYSVAGGTGIGIIRAAKENKKYVIGVDADQDHLAKGYVLTSMMKRLDNTVVDMITKFMNNELKGNEVYRYNYANSGVSITSMKYTKDKIPQNILLKIRNIEKKIKKGQIKITNLLRKNN